MLHMWYHFNCTQIQKYVHNTLIGYIFALNHSNLILIHRASRTITLYKYTILLTCNNQASGNCEQKKYSVTCPLNNFNLIIINYQIQHYYLWGGRTKRVLSVLVVVIDIIKTQCVLIRKTSKKFAWHGQRHQTLRFTLIASFGNSFTT